MRAQPRGLYLTAQDWPSTQVTAVCEIISSVCVLTGLSHSFRLFVSTWTPKGCFHTGRLNAKTPLQSAIGCSGGFAVYFDVHSCDACSLVFQEGPKATKYFKQQDPGRFGPVLLRGNVLHLWLDPANMRALRFVQLQGCLLYTSPSPRD